MRKLAYSYIRFSTPEQQFGDSERRQVEKAKEYCIKNGLTLADNTFADRGVSAWRGKNQTGALGELLNILKHGDYLLVEDQDRLSRQNPLDAANLLFSIVNKGVSIVTLRDGNIITAGNFFTLGSFLPSILKSALASEESEKKSMRLRESVNNAIEQAAKGIQSASLKKFLPECFAWNGTQIIIDEKKAATIRLIFELFNKGIGTTSICKQLNTNKVPQLYKAAKKGWVEAGVKHILRNATYSGVLKAKGHIIDCPPVVSKEIFDKTQLLLDRFKQRKGKTSGRVNNIFSSLSACAHCGGKVAVHSRMKRGKLSLYFHCKNARVGNCNDKTMLNANVVEHLFFMIYFGGSPEHITEDPNQLNLKIDAVNAKIERLTKAIDGLYDMAEEGDKEAKDRITARRIQKAEAEQELVLLKGQSVEQEHLPSMMEELIKMTIQGKSVDWTEWNIALMDKLADDNIRLCLRSILPSIFEKVVFDTTARTVEGVLRKGVRLPNAMIKEGPIRLPVGGKLEATVGDGKMMLGYKEPPPGKALVELK
jgi:DNA invertase Pin-like site-specific DNA recombinase